MRQESCGRETTTENPRGANLYQLHLKAVIEAMTNCRLSTRVSLRWPPEPAFENTDTLVMSVGNWYVDLRVDRATGTIDWAIAGERLQDKGSSARSA